MKKNKNIVSYSFYCVYINDSDYKGIFQNL